MELSRVNPSIPLEVWYKVKSDRGFITRKKRTRTVNVVNTSTPLEVWREGNIGRGFHISERERSDVEASTGPICGNGRLLHGRSLEG